MDTNKFDELLTQLGTGKWNLLYFFATSLWFFLIPPQVLSGTYLTPSMDYICLPPENLSATVTENNCEYGVKNASSGEVLMKRCTEWEFNTTVFTYTLTSQFDLVCDREYLRASYQSMLMFGNFFSPLVGGYLADRFGRRLVVIVTLAIFTASGTIISFLNNFSAILALRFLIGCVNLPTFYILAMEVCEPRLRSFAGILMALPWAFGTMAWGGIAFVIRDWRWLQLAVSLPNLLLFPALYLMDESPRWLIIRGRHQQAMTVLQKAASWNKVSLPPRKDLLEMMMDIQKESEATAEAEGKIKEKISGTKKLFGFLPVPILCRNRQISVITVVMCIDYAIVAAVFYGLSLNGTNFSADPFVYMVLTGLMEVPAYSFTAPVIARLGRKTTTIACYMISGVSLLALAFIPANITWLVMTLAMVGKMCISAAYQTLYVYVTELFPTEARLQGMGSAMVCSRIGSSCAPFVTDFLGPLVKWAPTVVFGAGSVVAGFVTLAVKETLGIPLPDTIGDLRDNSRNRKDKIPKEEQRSAGRDEESELQSFNT